LELLFLDAAARDQFMVEGRGIALEGIGLGGGGVTGPAGGAK
jgi:hypothetical protein